MWDTGVYYWEIITVESVILTNLSAIWAYGSRSFCHFTPSLWYLWVDLPDIHLSKHFLTFRLKAAINIETKLLILTTFFRVKNRIIVQRRVIEHVSVFASTLKKSIGAQVLFPKRERVFHRGIQTPRNKWKHEAVGRVLLLFRGVWIPRWNTKHEFWK